MNDDYGKTKPLKERLEDEATLQEQAQRIAAGAGLPASMTPFSPPYPAAPSSDFLERDRRKMVDIHQTRNMRAGDPERFRRDTFGLRSVPGEPSLHKKEADLTPNSCAAPTQPLTAANIAPRMAQISARSLLIASVTLIPTQPTETQWSAIKEAILVAHPQENEE